MAHSGKNKTHLSKLGGGVGGKVRRRWVSGQGGGRTGPVRIPRHPEKPSMRQAFLLKTRTALLQRGPLASRPRGKRLPEGPAVGSRVSPSPPTLQQGEERERSPAASSARPLGKLSSQPSQFTAGKRVSSDSARR